MAVRIGELLLKEKRITPEQLQQALNAQRQNGGKLGNSLVSLGLVKDEEITALLSKQYGVPAIALDKFEIDPAVLRLVPSETAQKYGVIPLTRSGAKLTIAMTDPTNVFAMDDIKFMTGYNVEPVVASEGGILAAIQKYYGSAPAARFNGNGNGNGTGSSGGNGGTHGQPSGPSALEAASKALEEISTTADAGDVEVLEEIEEISAEALTRQGE